MQFRRDPTDGSMLLAGSPLAGHPLFASRDLDETREKVARVFCPHRLDVIGRDTMRAEHNRVPGDTLSLNYLSYGAKTLIAPGELETFYLVQIRYAEAPRFPAGRIATIRMRRLRQY